MLPLSFSTPKRFQLIQSGPVRLVVMALVLATIARAQAAEKVLVNLYGPGATSLGLAR